MTEYCFGEATEAGRNSFEEHLLQCDACWHEVQRLEACVRLLRVKRALRRVLWTPGTIGVLGISARLDRLYGGHLWMVSCGVLLYGLLYALSFVFEIAYEFDQFGKAAVRVASFGVLPGIALLSLVGLGIDWSLTRRGGRNGLWLSLLVSIALATAAVLVSSLFLPNRPITLRRVQAYPAPAAYLKDSLYYVPLWVFFVVIPFHAVLILQRELKAGRYRNILSLLCGEKTAITPGACILLRAWHLGVLLVVAILGSFYLTTNLLDNLEPSPFMALFINLIQIRTLCYFALGTGAVLWYSYSLNEVKRECAAALSLNQKSPTT